MRGFETSYFVLSRAILAAALAAVTTSPALAQTGSSAPSVLGRDVTVSQAREFDQSNQIIANDAVTNGVMLSPEPTVSNGIFIGGINIDTDDAVQRSVFAPVIESYVGRTIARSELSALAKSLADQARAEGYIFASAVIPQQSVDRGIVTVKVDSGPVDEVRIVGSNNRHLRKILAAIRCDAAKKDVVERQLFLAGDIPGIDIVATRYAREGDKGILIVTVREDRARGGIYADNFGTKGFGPVRVRVETELTGLVTSGDSLSTQMLVTPLDLRELFYVSARYAVPVGDSGTTLALSGAAGRTQPYSDIVTGHSRYASLSATHPLLRSNDASVWAGAEIAYLNVEQDVLGVLVQQDTIVTFSANVSGNAKFGGGRIAGGIGIVQGLGKTGRGDLFSSRFDASGEFTKFQLWMNFNRPLGDGFAIRVAANAQFATTPLLAAQEIGLGGPGFGRGYDFSERFGDSGVLGTFELRKTFDNPLPRVDWARFYGFVDGGYVYNLRGGFGDGALASGGGGVRAALGRAELDLEAAFPINERRFEGNSRSPRVNVSMGYSF